MRSMKLPSRLIINLYSRLYLIKSNYWWFRYRLSNIYNNFLADYFYNFWKRDSHQLVHLRGRRRLIKALALHDAPYFIKVKRNSKLFNNVNVYLNWYEYYANKKYYLNKYLSK